LETRKLKLKDNSNSIFVKNTELFGEETQKRLKRLKIAVIGAGGTGTPVLVQLVRLGVKDIFLFDNDVIQSSNLNRQFMFGVSEIDEPKAEVLKRKIDSWNIQGVDIKCFNEYICDNNISMLDNRDFIFDCCDNFRTKFLLNDFCVSRDIVLIHSGVNRYNGQVYIVNGCKGKSLRYFFSEVPEEEKNINIISNAMLTANIQVNEFLRFLMTGRKSGMIFFETFPDFAVKVMKVD